MDYDLLCRLRVHARAELTQRVLHHLVTELPAKGIRTFVVVCADRPSVGVSLALAPYHADKNVLLMDAPIPVMSSKHGQRWIEVLNAMDDAFDATGHTARWSADTDDDRLFGPGWARDSRGGPGLYECLQDEAVVVWEEISLFLWDEKNNVNIRQYHWHPWLARYRRGERRRTDRIIGISDWAQKYIDENPRALRILPFYLLDYGSVDAAERTRLYREYARAGKNDPYTRRYIEAPVLRRLEELLVLYPRPADFKEWQRGIVTGELKVE